MTTQANLSPAFVQLFDAEVHQAYQSSAVLQGAARTRTGVVGSTVNFPKVGKGQASVRTPATDVVPLNTAFSSVSCSLTDYVWQQNIQISFCSRKSTLMRGESLQQ